MSVTAIPFAPGNVVRLRNLQVSLQRAGQQMPVIRGIDLDIGAGEIVAIVGESGSGKSVLAMTLMGLLPAASQPHIEGQVQVAGLDMLNAQSMELRELRRHKLGVIFQDPMGSLNPTMRVGAQIVEATRDPARALQLMLDVGIREAEQRFHSYPHEMSGGMRQRVMAAMALAGQPQLIIADEPTTALDVTVQAQFLQLLLEMRTRFDCSILFITHDLAVAAQISDRIAVMYAGRIAELGPTRSLIDTPQHPYTVGLLQSSLSLHTPRNRLLPTLTAESTSAVQRLQGCAYASRCPLAQVTCSDTAPTLRATDSGAAEHLRACWAEPALLQALGQPGEVIGISSSSSMIQSEGGAPALQIRDLHSRFHAKSGSAKAHTVHALRGIDLTVARGESLAIVGESGCGKSTLLRAIAGLAPVSEGNVVLGAGGAQMVFQDAAASLTPWLTVGDLLRERLRPLKLGRRAADLRIAGVLASLGLGEEVAAARPVELSGGQKQRVALARATLIPPAVLLCDEPTSALDASLAAQVLNLIRQLRQQLGMTVLFVTHDLAVARLMGERIAVMTQGQMVELGETEAVLHRPQHPYTRALLAALPVLKVAA
jgi:peptide/nickel transport system ATP-binding protein